MGKYKGKPRNEAGNNMNKMSLRHFSQCWLALSFPCTLPGHAVIYNPEEGLQVPLMN